MTPSHRSLPTGVPRRQRGVVLMVALIVLVALTLAGLSMIRSSDTGVIIAGNLSFRQSAGQALDAGVEAAITALPASLAGSEAAQPGKYHPFILQDTEPAPAGDGLPDLPGGQKWEGSGNPSNAYAVNEPGGLKGYTVRYVIERMCFNTGSPVTDLDAPGRCNVEQAVSGLQSNKLDPGRDIGQFRKLHYRVTVKVEGPRNTETFAQVLLSR